MHARSHLNLRDDELSDRFAVRAFRKYLTAWKENSPAIARHTIAGIGRASAKEGVIIAIHLIERPDLRGSR